MRLRCASVDPSAGNLGTEYGGDPTIAVPGTESCRGDGDSSPVCDTEAGSDADRDEEADRDESPATRVHTGTDHRSEAGRRLDGASSGRQELRLRHRDVGDRYREPLPRRC